MFSLYMGRGVRLPPVSQFRGCGRSQVLAHLLGMQAVRLAFQHFLSLDWAFQCYLAHLFPQLVSHVVGILTLLVPLLDVSVFLNHQLHLLYLYVHSRWYSVSGGVLSGLGFPVWVSTLTFCYSDIVCSGATLSLGWCCLSPELDQQVEPHWFRLPLLSLFASSTFFHASTLAQLGLRSFSLSVQWFSRT